MRPLPPIRRRPARRPMTVSTPCRRPAVRSIIAGIILRPIFLSARSRPIIAPGAADHRRFHLGDFENLSWVVDALSLSATAVTPMLFGKLSDVYGRRRIVSAGRGHHLHRRFDRLQRYADAEGARGARAASGIGGGGILPIAQAIIADLVLAAGGRATGVPVGPGDVHYREGVVGPVLGGIPSPTTCTGRSIFWINVPMGALALIAELAGRWLKRLPRNERLQRLGRPTPACWSPAALALMLAMSWGGVALSGGIVAADPCPRRGVGSVLGAVRVAARHRRRTFHSPLGAARAGGGRHGVMLAGSLRDQHEASSNSASTCRSISNSRSAPRHRCPAWRSSPSR